MENPLQSERDLLLADPSSSNVASVSAIGAEADSLDISTRCEKCLEDLDGPCYEHADVKRIIFDKPPNPLAYSSLPDAICLLDGQLPRKEEMVIAKRKIEALTLFGPLIAPLVPLYELKEGPPRYTIWSEEAQELQAYDMRDNFLCNWIKFIRPCSSRKEANVIAYQQRGSVYLVAVRDIFPSEELRVYNKLPNSGAIQSHQLSALVLSLLASCKRPGSELPQVNNIDNIVLEMAQKVASKRKRVFRTRRTKMEALPVNVESSLFGSIGNGGIECCRDDGSSEITVVEESVNEERQPQTDECAKPLGRRRKQTKDWYWLDARYKAGNMTDEEKKHFESDERTLEQRKVEEANRLKHSFEKRVRRKNKLAQMTEEEREAYDARKREANATYYARNAPNNNKLLKLVREKYIQGLPLTAEELAQYEAYLKRNREKNALMRRKTLIAAGRDPEKVSKRGPGKGPMFAWQLARRETTNVVDEADVEAARCIAVEERNKNGTSIPSYRLKLRQELPLTSEELAAYQKELARKRERDRRYYRKTKIAQGLQPKEVISRRKTPLEGPGKSKKNSEDHWANSSGRLLDSAKVSASDVLSE
ncbi:hypothetical protein RvY_00429 [Ramazzottius varieornatus]|uniref:SET domain-containing protein n=1 Tax=Ramazzottius varieornatus TaxID=947166 RepID=A0A1D1UGU1_RAMVA|nr:hypothetical protein RvY_00429 [Ramazzottius varieornatus]